MGKTTDWIRLRLLMIKAKLIKIYNSAFVQWFFEQDITFIMVFFALYLFGYFWNWKVLLASFGLWYVAKEIFKYLRTIASEVRPRG